MSERYRCPCCGYYTLGARGNNDICPVCFWEDDRAEEQSGQPVEDRPEGPNGVQLREARENYIKFGASEERIRWAVRPPLESELPENNQGLGARG
jgi:hypothetical protein